MSLLFCITTAFALNQTEFLYPVSEIIHEEEHKMCVLYQKNNHLELWFWNPLTGESTKGLLSSFSPSGLTVLPNKKTFSFIDNDRIRIKHVNKRSPKSIDLYGPYDLTLIHWIDDHSFYFGAKERQHNNLFHATVDGDLFRLTVSNDNDYTYPVKIENALFCIERSDEHGYRIIKTEYPLKKINNNTFDAPTLDTLLKNSENEYTQYLDLENAESIITLHKNTSAFLRMHTTEQGFFIEHPSNVNRTDEVITFSYHTFFKYDQKWKTEKLFDFTLPLHLLLPQQGKTRLYESILPFLPFHDQDIIYYSDLCVESNSVVVFSYDCHQKRTLQKTKPESPDSLTFPPTLFQDRLFSGGTLTDDSKNYSFKNSSIPSITINQSGVQYFNFVEIPQE